MKPTTSQIDAYCAALKAFHAGERVEFRVIGGWNAVAFNFPPLSAGLEYRIAPAPPKLREFELDRKAIERFGTEADNWWGQLVYVSFGSPGLSTDKFIHVREVSETADAEIAEKLRNHDALRSVLQVWFDLDNPTSQRLAAMLAQQGIPQ